MPRRATGAKLRSHLIAVRLSLIEAAMLEQLSERVGLNVSDYFRDHIRSAFRHHFGDQLPEPRALKLDADDVDEPAPTARASKATKRATAKAAPDRIAAKVVATPKKSRRSRGTE